MRIKVIGVFVFISFILLFYSCALNIFSGFNPSNVDNVNDVNTLLAMGDTYLYNLDYENAFKAYTKVLSLDSDNSLAIEGSCTAYLGMKLSVTNFVLAIMHTNYDGLKNRLYDVSSYIQRNLYRIVNNEADGVIPYDDVNINFNFFLFNTVHSVFYVADTDNDGDVEYDTNDFLIIASDFTPTISPAVTNMINSSTNTSSFNLFLYIKLSAIIRTVNDRLDYFDASIARSTNSLNNVKNSLTSTEAKEELDKISEGLITAGEDVTLAISNLQNTTFNSISIFSLTNAYMITNLLTPAVYFALVNSIYTGEPPVTNDIALAGYTVSDFTLFTNNLIQAGISTPAELTNLMPAAGDVNQYVSNYFGL